MNDHSHKTPYTLHPENWVDSYGEYFINYAYIRLRDISVAEDIVQDTFLSALKNRQRFRGEASEKTWLTAIIKNKINDYLRSRYRATEEFNEELYCEQEEVFDIEGRWRGHWIWNRGPADWNVSPDFYLEQKEFWKAMELCLKELPERFAIIFTLYELERLPAEEICKDLNISQSNLWVILHRVRKQLRRCLEIRWLGDKPYGKYKK